MTTHPQTRTTPTKRQRRLQRRQADYALMMSTKSGHGGIDQRKSMGGYHKPGSNNK